MKDNSTTNHKVLSHTQIKSMMKPLQIKLNSGLTTGGFFAIIPDAFFKLNLN